MTRQFPIRPQQRQPQQQRQRFAGNAARQQPPEGHQQRQRQREPARLRQPQQRKRTLAHPRKQRPARIERHRRQSPHRCAPTRVQRFQPRTDQRQRHDQQTPPRDRQQIRERPYQRRLSEQHHCQRQQSDRRHALRSEEFAQWMLPALRQTPQQPRHAAETQPEASGQHRQRIAQQDRDHRHRQRIDRPPTATQDTRCRNNGDHQHRAHGGQGKTGECGIQHRTEQRRDDRHLRPRHATAQRRPTPPHRAHQQRKEPRDQADMKAGDRDEMGEPARAQLLPVGIVQRAGVAQRERAQKARR